MAVEESAEVEGGDGPAPAVDFHHLPTDGSPVTLVDDHPPGPDPAGADPARAVDATAVREDGTSAAAAERSAHGCRRP